MSILGAGNELRGAQHLLRAMGLEQVVDKVRDLKASTKQMNALADNYQKTGGLSAPRLGQMFATGRIPAQLPMPPADASTCKCANNYSPNQSFTFNTANTNAGVQQLAERQPGPMLERFLQTQPFARQKLEMMLGGRVLPGGVQNGRLQIQQNPMVQPYGAGGLGGPRAVAAANAQGYLNQLNQAAMRGPAIAAPMTGALPGMGAGANQGALPQALMGALRNLLAGGGLPNGVQALPAPMAPQAAPLMGGGAVPPPPMTANAPMGAQGARGPNQGLYANGGRGGGNMFGAGDPNMLNAIMAGGMPGGGAMTVEDMVTLMLMMIMKKMDKDIQGQAQRVNQLQQQQGAQGGQQGQPPGAPSIDVETMKMKRTIDKRSQMFDMLRQVIDKYNETAKNIIQSVGR